MNYVLGIFVASLPFYSVRALGLSLPLVVMILIGIVQLVRFSLFRRLTAIAFGAAETAIAVLLCLSLFSMVLSNQPSAGFFLTKGIFYFLSYLLLKSLIAEIGNRVASEACVRGAYVGTLLYLSLVVVAVASSGLQLSVANYYTLTVNVQIAIDSFLGYERDIIGAHIMRNSIAEVFALFCVLPFVYSNVRRVRRLDYVLVSIAFVVVLATFSRRAVVEVGVIFLLLSFARGSSIRNLIGISAGLVFCVGVFGHLGAENRFVDIVKDSRWLQYTDAINGFSILGEGYGAQLLDQFGFGISIHNFILSYSFMLGVSGLLVSCWIMCVFVFRLMRVRESGTFALMSVPIVGMTVGGGDVGFFTPAAWLCMAICFHDSERSKLLV